MSDTRYFLCLRHLGCKQPWLPVTRCATRFGILAVAIWNTLRRDESMTNKRRIVDDELYAHFVTFTCYRRRRLLDYDHPKRILLGVLNHQLTKMSAKCVGFVIMPDHVHAIVWFSETGQLTRFMHGWKRMSSFSIREWYRTEHPEYFKDFGEGDAFWQAKYYSFEIYSTEKLEENLEYMHLNPVRADLVERTTEYKWSSARWYDSRRSVGVPIEWIG